VKIVKIPYNDQRGAAGVAIEMSYWCRDHGLVRDLDYDWAFITAEKEIHFRFFNDNDSYATLFALKWAGNEV